MNKNKWYLVNTLNKTYINKKVKVLATDTSLEFAETIPFNISSLALNEHVTDLAALADYAYYICKDEDDKYIILWDEILDLDRTNELDKQYSYKLLLTINNSLTVPREVIIDSIKTTVEQLYPDQVSLSVVDLLETDSDRTLELFKEKGKIVDNYINKILSGTETIDKLYEIITTKNSIELIDEMYNDIATIKSNIGKIAAMVS